MANEQNLIPNEMRTPEERRENARKAGIASGKARKKSKLMRELLNTILDTKLDEHNTQQALKMFPDLDPEQATRGLWFVIDVINILTERDENTKEPKHKDADRLKAFEIIRDTAGQKPVEQQIVAFDESNQLIIDLDDDEGETDDDVE